MKFVDKTPRLEQKIDLKVGDYFLTNTGEVRQLVEINNNIYILDVAKGKTSIATTYSSVSNFFERFTKYNGKITKIHVSEIIYVKSGGLVGFVE